MITTKKETLLEIVLTKVFKVLNNGNGSFEAISRMNSPYGNFRRL
jgi:hypothetical protein